MKNILYNWSYKPHSDLPPPFFLPKINRVEIQCAILGSFFFFLLFGTKILNPTFISWLLSGDSATHFLGWHFFRSEPWSFPLGTIRSYMYPKGTSIVFTDSLPLLAIPLKFFSALLPQPFQYQGLWMLITYTLQGFFGAKLISQITQDRTLIVIGVIFFLLSPIMTFLACDQVALASHWLILAALYLYLSPHGTTKQYHWLILLMLASLIHFYLFFMAGIIWVAYLWRLYREGIPLIKMMTISIGLTGLTMWAAGYFVIGLNSTSIPGYGVMHMMNLLAPIIPPSYLSFTFDTAKFLPSMSSNIPGRPSFNYLGLGTVLMTVFALHQLIAHPRTFLDLKKHSPLIVASFIFFILAISNKIIFYNFVLFEINLPLYLQKLLGVIRTGNRMFWPIAYLIVTFSIATISKFNNEKKATKIIIIMLIIQIIDLYPVYKNIDRTKVSFNDPLQSKEWDRVIKKISHIVVIPPERYRNDYIPFALMAANNKKTINIGYAGRTNSEQSILQEKIFTSFNRGIYSTDTLYIIKNNYPYTPLINDQFTFKIIDGYYTIFPERRI